MPSLTLRVLGNRDEGVVDEFQFYGGEATVLRLQIIDAETEQKHCLPADAISIIILSATPNNIQYDNASIAVDTSDRSIVSISLLSAATLQLITGMIQFSYSSAAAGVTRYATEEFGLKRLTKITE